MGRVKALLMDFEEKVEIIEGLVYIFSSETFDEYVDSSMMNNLYMIKGLINELDHSSVADIKFLSDILDNEVYENYRKLKSYHNLLEVERDQLNSSSQKELKFLIIDLAKSFERVIDTFKRYLSRNSRVYNSESYYNEQIKELQNQKEQLENYLRSIQNKQQHLEGKSKEEIAFHKHQIQQKEIDLQAANIQIENLKKELEEKKKQESAISEWNNKIKSTFTELTKYLSPIKNEYTRLNVLFWVYGSLICLIIILLIIIEAIICCKFSESIEIPKWKDYIMLMVPIPLAGALLWAFISQANRAQRQLVILAKHIHEIKYIEGLLLSINSLSSNIEDSMKRVNIAIDRLLENHLNVSTKSRKFSEDDIINEEKRDMVPYDLVIKLLKEAKGIMGK